MFKQAIFAILMLVMFSSGRAWAVPEIPLPPEDEQAIKDNPDVFTDLGAYRVVVIRGKQAFVMYEQAQSHRIIIDEEKHLLIILDLTEDI